MTTFAIGDVQGCYDSLRRLLDHIGFDDTMDRLWFVGDLVNRGPHSLEVLRFVHGLGAGAVVVLGNHDLHLLAAQDDRSRLRATDSLARVLDAADAEELCDWLAHQPLLHRDDVLGFVMTHAGIPSVWSLEEARLRAEEIESVLRAPARQNFFRSMYGNAPSLWSDDLEGFDRLRLITNYLTRMRAIRGRCQLDLSFKDGAHDLPLGSRPWFEDYRDRTLPSQILFGHWAALEGRCDVPGIHALDTGCVWGGRLSALRLIDLERFSVASVQ